MNGDVSNKEMRRIKGEYKNHLTMNEASIDSAWIDFEDQLKKNEYILKYIEQQNLSGNLKIKFHEALNRNDGLLYSILYSVPELQKAFDNYNDISSHGFDWDKYINYLVIGEYATHIEQRGKWLLPVELQIMAYALNKKILFFNANGKNSQLAVQSEVYNPESKYLVAVKFNGKDHFERYYPTSKELKEVIQSKQNSFGEIKIQQDNTLRSCEAMSYSLGFFNTPIKKIRASQTTQNYINGLLKIGYRFKVEKVTNNHIIINCSTFHMTEYENEYVIDLKLDSLKGLLLDDFRDNNIKGKAQVERIANSLIITAHDNFVMKNVVDLLKDAGQLPLFEDKQNIIECRIS